MVVTFFVGAASVSEGSAYAQRARAPKAAPAPDPKQVELEAQVSAQREELAGAKTKLAEQSQALAAQKTALEAQAAAQAALDQRLAGLEQNMASEAKARAQAEARATTLEKQVGEIKPSVSSSGLGISLAGFAQADLVLRESSEDQVVESTSEPKNEDRFLLRRARLRVSADKRYAMAALELDANSVKGSQVRVVGAELGLTLPADDASAPALLQGRIGLFKIPFGYEVVQSDRERLFLERTQAARALFPGEYDVGAKLAGAWRALRWTLAVQNGEPLGAKGFPGRDPNAAKDLTGRAGVDMRLGDAATLAAGSSILVGTGFHKGTPQTKDVLVWRDVNENGSVEGGEIQVIPGQAATASENFERFAVGLDLHLSAKLPKLGKLDLAGELVVAKNLDRGLLVADPVTQTRDLRELGFYVAVTQDLGEHFTLGLRYDHYDPDADATDRQAGSLVANDASYTTFAMALGFRFHEARFVAEYDLNQNHLGRDLSGKPQNLADNAFLLRAQVEF